MVESLGPIGVGLVAAGWAGQKLLGPLFDEIAEDWRARYSGHRTENLNRIGRIAQEKVGDGIDEPGSVPPRVAQRVMEDGTWCDAPVMAEYFGGILAASRTPDGDDDRGASWAGLISRLASFDVLLHYVVYTGIRSVFVGNDFNLGLSTDLSKAMTFFPYVAQDASDGLLPALAQGASATALLNNMTSSLNALVREGLVGDHYSFGGSDFIQKRHRFAPTPGGGLVVQPSAAGVELYLWAHGRGDLPINSFLVPDIEFDAVEDLPAAPAFSVKEMQKQQEADQVRERSGVIEPPG